LIGAILKVGICTGGGDCPGLNAIIRAFVKHGASNLGLEIIGIKDSFNGLMSRPYEITTLSEQSVSEILFKGGTILGTTNNGNPFSLKEYPKSQKLADKSQYVLEAYKDLGLSALVVIGGDGTQGIAYQLSQLGINIIGIPKTIDNDLAATDQTVGFDTAVQVAAEAAFRLQSTAESHQRVMILEVMGRGAGHLALHSGIAGGAHIILLPEIPFKLDSIAKKIRQRQEQGKRYSVIVVAEGAIQAGQEEVYAETPEGKKNLGGIGRILGSKIFDLLGLETRVTALGHTQRGGTPSPVDRILGTAYGVAAATMAKKMEYGRIVSFKGGAFTTIDYKSVAGRFRPVDQHDPILKAAESIGICLGR